MKTFFSLVPAALLFFAATVAGAAEYQIRAVTIEPGFPKGEVFAHEPGSRKQGKLLKVNTYLNHESETLKADGKVLILTDKADPASAKDEASIFGQVEFAANRESAILVFLPAAKQEEGKEVPGLVVDVDDSRDAFPPGSILVVNRSVLPIKIELGEETYELKPDENHLIEKFPGQGRANYKALAERDGEWVSVAAGIWPSPERKRAVQVITDVPGGRNVSIRGIRDVAAIP